MEIWLGKQQDNWGKLSSVLCMLYNTNVTKHHKKPEDFNPFSKVESAKGMKLTADNGELLGRMFARG